MTAGPRRTPTRNVCLGVLLLWGCAGCATPDLPPIQLSDPGWEVRKGQAVWQAERHGTGIAGDLILAVHPDQRGLAQFTKAPFPLAQARIEAERWELTLPQRKRAFSGTLPPPEHVVWFALIAAFTDEPLPFNWSLHLPAPERWRLENHRTGEFLEGYWAK
jgi:hypothetical protein